LVRTREDKTESIDYFKGGMSGALNLQSPMGGRSANRAIVRQTISSNSSLIRRLVKALTRRFLTFNRHSALNDTRCRRIAPGTPLRGLALCWNVP
jgi:hypothetical protein